MKANSMLPVALALALATPFAGGAVAAETVRLAVFGGDDSRSADAKSAKELWNRQMPCTWDDYGAADADLPSQVTRALDSGRPYDMFVIWCSAADATRGETLRTAVGRIRSRAPRGQVVLFTPVRKDPVDPALAARAEDLACTGSSLSVSVLDLYRDVSPSMSAGDCQAKYLKYIRSVGWGIDPSAVADKEDLARVTRRTQRLHDAKWGVFNHFLGHGIKTADEWNAKVAAYDVRKVADQLEACGAKFYFLTLMQGRRWTCAPNATYDRIAGTKPGEACATRDLPMELSGALQKRGIDLYLYYTGDGPYMDKEIGPRFGFTEPRFLGVTGPFVEKWASVLEEYAVRYGDRVRGWWIDGCYAGYLRYTEELLEPYAKAVRKGNPDAAIALNNGVEDHYARYSRHADFTAGEFNDFYCVPSGRFVGGAQAFALIPLGAWGADGSPAWGCGGCKRGADYVADYVKLVNANGGVVAIDVRVGDDGSWLPEQMEVLKAVGRITGTLRK